MTKSSQSLSIGTIFSQDEVYGKTLGLKNGHCSLLELRDNSQTEGQISLVITDSSVPRK